MTVDSHAATAMRILRRATTPMAVKELKAKMLELGMVTRNVGGVSHRVRSCLQNLKRQGRVTSPKPGYWELSAAEAARNPFKGRSL